MRYDESFLEPHPWQSIIDAILLSYLAEWGGVNSGFIFIVDQSSYIYYID